MKKQYKIIKLPKGNGSYRTIYAPSKAYKEKLKSFLLDLQQKVHDSDEDRTIHGFLRGRSPSSNANRHIGYAYTLSLDIKDFFDSVKVEMVREYLSDEEQELCFIEGIARQGLPTSPLIANLAFLKLDEQIKRALEEQGVYTIYTRYADDLIFSFNHKEFAPKLQALVEKIVNDGGFKLNTQKSKLQCATNGRRMITGFGVDERAIHPSRKLKRKIRAAIHQENREKAFGLLSWAECKEPKAFYTDRALLNKNIFHDDALDLSNDFFLSNLLSFETYVANVEDNFEDDSVVHETDREKWEKQKSAFLAQREAFYAKEKQHAEAQRKATRKHLEKRFVAEEEVNVAKPTQQKKSTKGARENIGATTIETKEEERVKELNVDFDALKEIEQEQVASFQDEKRVKRRKSEEIKQKSDEQEEKKQLLNKLFIASILPIVLMIGVMSYYFSATEVEVKESYPLFIETVPYDAKIQIMNIIDKYTMGIELKPGEYDIRISKKGYTTQRFKIQMKHQNIIIKRELKKIKKRKVY